MISNVWEMFWESPEVGFLPNSATKWRAASAQTLRRVQRPEDWGCPRCATNSLVCLPASAGPSASQPLPPQGVELDQRFLTVLWRERLWNLSEHKKESPGKYILNPQSSPSTCETDSVGQGERRTQKSKLLARFLTDSDARPLWYLQSFGVKVDVLGALSSPVHQEKQLTLSLFNHSVPHEI